MFRPPLALCIPLLVTAALHAAEVTVEEQPFVIEAVFDASVMPESEVLLLDIGAKAWEDFRFVEIAEHGAKMRKGDFLATFDTAEIDRQLEDTRRAVAAGTLAVAQADQKLKELEETVPHRLAAARLAAEIAKEENAYFTTTRRKAEEESADHSLARSQQLLANQMEELRQLTKMYQADDLTEETEEIILTRQKDHVAAAEFSLRMATLSHKRTIEVTLPREAVTLANNERDTAIALRAAEQEIPREIELKKLELESLTSTLGRDKKTLADIEHDRPLFEFIAPAEGWFYHGPIRNGRWTTGDLLKALAKSGRPPVRRPFATFIPATATLSFTAFLDQATARSLKTGLTGTASFAGREDLEIPVALTELAGIPEPDGTFRSRLSATWPKDFTPAVGTSAQVRLVSYQQPAAILVPSKALDHDSRGWTVEIMLADGKTEHRPVKRGRVSDGQTEILDGLEIGQVIVAP